MNGTTLLIHYSERETTPEKLDAYAKSLGLSTEQLIKRFPDYHRDSASFSNRCGIGAVRIPALAKSVTIHSRLNR